MEILELHGLSKHELLYRCTLGIVVLTYCAATLFHAPEILCCVLNMLLALAVIVEVLMPFTNNTSYGHVKAQAVWITIACLIILGELYVIVRDVGWIN